MLADEKSKREIIGVLNEYAKSYAEKNINNLTNLVSPEDDTILIGSGGDEWVVGLSEIKKGFERDLEQSDSISIDFGDIAVSMKGDVAWTATTMTMKVSLSEEVLILNGRVSFVFEKRENKWVIVHLHYSLPNDDQIEGQSFPEVN